MSQLLVKIFILFASVAVFRTEVTVENGGFSNVLVSFSQNVPSDKGQALLENLRTHLAEASEILQNSIGLRINQVTFLIPKAWDTSQWNITSEPSTERPGSLEADIVVDNTKDNVFGTFPFAQQYGSCGTPGHQLIISSHFLTEENTFPKGTALAREWLKFRYGVFDENGYPRDEQYPLYYAIPGSDATDVLITECTNEPVTYTFLDGDGNNCSTTNAETGLPEGCFIMPDKESLDNVTSSLMYFQEHMHNMQDVCGKKEEHPHNAQSPNKHNALCRERSIWNIIETSIDFSVPVDITEGGDIEFNYVQEPSPKVVFALENTNYMKDQGPTLFNAIKRIIYGLPKGSKYVAYSYMNKTITEELILKELNNWPDDWKTDLKASFLYPGESCASCAISKALGILSPGDVAAAAGTAVIIASSNLKADEAKANDDLLQMLKNSKICLLLLVFSDGETPQAFKDYASASPCGYVTELSKKSNNVTLFENLFQAMESVLPERVDDKVTTTVITELLRKDSPLSFDVDDTVEKITFWIFTQIETGLLEFKFNEEPIDVTEEITSTDLTALSYSPKQVGKIELKLSVEHTAITQVRITSKAGQYLHGHIFFHDSTPKDYTHQMPVIIYASIRFGAYPVQNAKVIATISRPDADNIELIMYDDGRGDPDITAHDGVYSRYFTEFNDKGEYTVTVNVAKDENTSGGKLDQPYDYQSCCGSKLQNGNLQLPDFTHTLQATFNAVSGKPENGYKPSRIVDLKIDSVSDGKIVLKWTAPGAEADTGTVENYEIIQFSSRNESDSGNLLIHAITPQEGGLKETTEVNTTDFVLNQLNYIAIRAKNGNQTSDISNIVEVFIPEKDTTSTETIKDDNKQASTDKKIVGIVIGVILAVIVLVVIAYLIVYFAVVKPRRKKEEKAAKENQTNQRSNQSIESHNLNPVSSVSADTLLKHHNEKVRAKIEKKEPPIFKEEDFERTSTMRNEPKDDNVDHPEYSEIKKDEEEKPSVPPKSPKRTTFV